MMPTQQIVKRSNGSNGGERARRPLPVIAGVVLLCFLGLFLTGCAPSDADLLSTLETTEDAETRREAAVELAGRHSMTATLELLQAVEGNPNAADGLAALRDASMDIIATPQEEEPSVEEMAGLVETLECLAAIGDKDAARALGEFAVTSNGYPLDARVRAVELLGDVGTTDALQQLTRASTLFGKGTRDSIRDLAATELRMHPESIAMLIAARTSSTGAGSWSIDRILASFGEPAAIELVAAMSDPDQVGWITWTLCKIEGQVAARAAVAGLGNEALNVRFGSLEALLCLHGKPGSSEAADAHLIDPEHIPLLIEARSVAGYDASSNAALEDILLEIGEPAVGPVMAGLGATDWVAPVLVRFGAVAAPPVAGLLGSDDPGIRSAAFEILLDIHTADPQAAGPILAAPERLPLLMEAFTDGAYLSQPDRASVIESALLQIGDPALKNLLDLAAGLITDDAGWTDATLGRRVYDLILRYDDDAITRGLVEKVTSDQAGRLHTLFLAVKLGVPGSEDSLNELLLNHGDRKMGEDYLNSGSSLLYEGGVRWGESHGLEVTSGDGSNRTTWGSF